MAYADSKAALLELLRDDAPPRSIDPSEIAAAVVAVTDAIQAAFVGHTHPQSEVTSLVADLAAKASLASPAFTGTPTAPTAAPAPASSTTSVTNARSPARSRPRPTPCARWRWRSSTSGSAAMSSRRCSRSRATTRPIRIGRERCH